MALVRYATTSDSVVNLNLIATSLGFRASAPEKGKGVIAVDYLPPLNADIQMSAQVKHQYEKAHTSASASAGTGGLPAGLDLQGTSSIGPPQNQLGCGSCWAVAVTEVLADRFALASKKPRVALSPTFLLSCESNALGCGGGSADLSGKFLETKGTVSSACWDYSWCKNNAGCRGGSGSAAFNSLLPSCTTGCSVTDSKASPSPTAKVWKAKAGTTRSLTQTHDIMSEIQVNGPVVASFHIFGDFIVGTMAKSKFPKADNWAATNNIYVHDTTRDVYNYGEIDCGAGTKKQAYQCSMGNHIVSVVGWGRADVPGYGSTGYWIARNSWGDKWNEAGFFKIAWTDKSKGMNVAVGFDTPLNVDGILFGGMTTFLPDLASGTATDPKSGNQYGSSKTSASSKSTQPHTPWYKRMLGQKEFSRSVAHTVIRAHNSRRWVGMLVFSLVLLLSLLLMYIAGTFVYPFDKPPVVIKDTSHWLSSMPAQPPAVYRVIPG